MNAVYEYKGLVTRIVDGDTIDMQIDLGFRIKTDIRVRILDIDTPEIYHPSCDEEKKHGHEAKDLAESLILNKPIIVRTKKYTGKYGRWLGKIEYIDGGGNIQDFATTMTDRGMEKRNDYFDKIKIK